ncbi:MAG: DUF2283 domain-containing protein [Thermodesulfobacteriota bacterium]
MKIDYDPEVDALYIELTKGKAAKNIDIEEGVTVDLDEEGHIVGIEILDARERFSQKDLSSVEITNIPMKKLAVGM